MPDDLDPLDGIDPQAYLDRLEAQKTPDEDSNRKLSRPGVFFYPACGFDWNPLHRFTHLCNVFVYCDIGMRLADFLNWDQSICRGFAPGIGLEVVQIADLKHRLVLN